MQGQQGNGSITGKLVDSTGARVSGANVTITNQATLTGLTLISDSEGKYASPPLTSGRYTIEIEKLSFRPEAQKDLELNDDQRAEVNFTLSNGSVTQEVNVQANAPALNSFNATLGSVIDNAVAEALPLNGSNALAIAQLDPGVVSGNGPVNEGFNDRGLGVSNIRIGGGLVGSNANLLDGANNLQTSRGEILINSTVTGIQETRLQYGVISSEFGLTSGGVISMTTRSGTNNLHGQVYEYVRNNYFNANNHFAIKGTKPALRYNQYGVAIGGAILHDRLFWFANYEGYKNTQVTPSIITVPTLLERTGDFSDQASNLYDPNTQTACTANSTTTCRYQFGYGPGTGKGPVGNPVLIAGQKANVLPASQLDPAAIAFQAAFVPVPNVGDATTLVNNYASNAPLLSSQKLSIGRLDWRVSNKNSLFARYAYYENITNGEGSYGALPLIASTRNDDLRDQDLTLGLTQVLSGTMLNDLRVAVGRSYFPFTAGSSGQNWPRQLGITGLPQNTLPNLSVANYGITVATNQGLRSSLVPEINDTVTLLHGTQSFRIGAGVRFYEAYNNSNAYPSGQFSFGQGVTGQAGTASVGTGNGYASFLLGLTNSVTATAAAPSVARSFSVNGFMQDDWRILPNLTLNLGIRYDFQSIPWEKANGFSTLRLDQINPNNGLVGREVFAGVNGSGRNFAAENYHDLGPRVGFAYLLSRKHQTVVRGGYALYYASTSNTVYANATDEFGSNTSSYASQSQNGYASHFVNGFLDPALTAPPSGLPGAAAGPGALLGQSPTVQPSAEPTSASQQFALSFDHQFAKTTVVSVSLLENHGTHFPMAALNLNQLNPSFYSLGQAALIASTTNPYASRIPAGTPGSLGGKNIQVLQALKPYPYFQNVYLYYPHIGSYTARSAQAVVRRTVATGLQLQMGYTFSKLLSDLLVPALTAGASIGTPLQNSYQPHSEYGIDNTDVRHRVSGNLTYTLPLGKGQRFFAHSTDSVNRLLSGWNLASTVIAESGRPLAITGNNSAGATRPDYVPGVSLKVANPGADQWFNTAAFIAAPPYTLGNVPRTTSQLRGPNALNINLNLQKQTKFRRYTGVFQISAFNIINKTNLGSPNTNYVAPSSTASTASAFGTITTALQARNLQATVRITF